MDAIRSISSNAEHKQELGSAEKKDDVINDGLQKEKIKPKQENDKPKRNDDDRINISISRKAYCASTSEGFTKEFNQGQAGNKKPFTIEEVLEEEILLLFSDECRK